MNDRDYFPQPRTTRPRPDAPTMAEAIAVIVLGGGK